ncbi:hypothetical protein [Hyphomicrobium sp. LHD-15]|uniref:hypothetical protein n=1 Tax=Hyphomicrobium sp. LHD-15 TaxID=3072142 RepID=UPI00280CA79C|nr:hypothetical protein [Hyphomicrobium sp. LHD-15]MDQ8699270.1 hypothetical protein [Hyphomicrobium sp. LHD-15]
MIVTHTANAAGHRRVYLGGKASMECWIQPKADGIAWTFHAATAPGRYPLTEDERRTWAAHILLALATMLSVDNADLTTVPFERIAALHLADPSVYRRMAVPRRQRIDQGYVSTVPDVGRPSELPNARDVFSSRRS